MQIIKKITFLVLLLAGGLGCQAPVTSTSQADSVLTDAGISPEPAGVPAEPTEPSPSPQESSHLCELAGTEKFGLYIDGVLVGFVSSYLVTDESVRIENGVIPSGKFVARWIMYNQGKPNLFEKHDLSLRMILAVTENGGLVFSKTAIEFQNTQITDLDFEIAVDRKTCLLVRSVDLTAEKVVATP